jgi:hypothetical protein
MGVVANKRRLLKPRQRTRVENPHGRLDVGDLRSRADLASKERRVKEIRSHSAHLIVKPSDGNHHLRD